MTIGLAERLRQRPPAHRNALLIGAVLPDLPLALLAGGYRLVRNVRSSPSASAAATDRFGIGCQDLFFNDPLWIVSYNLVHAPLVIAALFLIGWRGKRPALRGLAEGLALHSVVDILTHHDDGPLLFFPFDWRTRFPSPVSYWDRRRHGDAFTAFEYGLDLAVMVRLIVKGARAWFARKG